MRFRYFIASGKVKEAYDVVEIMQMTQEDARNKFLISHKVLRVSTGGFSNNVTGLIFEDGVEIPAGFTKPDKWDCVRPKAKGDEAKWWREQLENLNIKVDCFEALRKFIDGPSYVVGEYVGTGMSRYSYSTRAGYVGPNTLLIEIPDPKLNYKAPHGLSSFVKEIQPWKFEKLCHENGDYKSKDHYPLTSRTYDYTKPKVEKEEDEELSA